MRRLAGWIASLSYLAAMATLATWAFAWTVTDRWPWTQWIWWFPWLGYAAACFPAAAIAVFDRRPGGRRLRAAALLAGPVIAACGIFRDVGFTPRPVAGPSTLRIVQWNAPWPDTEAAAGPSGTIADRDADLVVISNPWRFFQSRKAEWTDRGYDVVQTGTFAFASRLPVLEARPLRAPPGSALAIVRIDARATWGRPVSVLAVDLPSDPKSSRMAFMSRIVDAIAVLEPGSIDAIVGDFNITRGSASLATAFPAHREAFSQAGSGWGASFEEPWPLLHIDLLLAGPGVQVDWCRLWSVGPRHRAQETWIRPAGQS
jgi:hypothetical protein